MLRIVLIAIAVVVGSFGSLIGLWIWNRHSDDALVTHALNDPLSERERSKVLRRLKKRHRFAHGSIAEDMGIAISFLENGVARTFRPAA